MRFSRLGGLSVLFSTLSFSRSVNDTTTPDQLLSLYKYACYDYRYRNHKGHW
jgi:hypothetical protein